MENKSHEEGFTPSEGEVLLNSVQRAAGIISALCFAGSLTLFGLEIAAYFLLGVLLATLNSWWLKAGLDRILRLSPDRAKGHLWRFFLRLFLIMICLYVTIQASFMGALACVGGLSVHILGAMAVGVRLAFKTAGGTPRVRQ